MPLNDRQIKNAKPEEKPYKLNDGKGLYLYINTTGGKLWRFDFAFNGKRRTLSIGKYPVISLAEAREAAESARRGIQQGKTLLEPSKRPRQSVKRRH